MGWGVSRQIQNDDGNEGPHQRRIDQAAGRMAGSISFNRGFTFPLLTFLSRCLFMSSIYTTKSQRK